MALARRIDPQSYSVALTAEDDFDGWREAARTLASAGIAPDRIVWRIPGAASQPLFDGTAARPAKVSPVSVPKAFADLAATAILHRDPARFDLLYTLLGRVLRDRGAIEDRADPLVNRLSAMAKAVRRDMHKMRAFVRFRRFEDGGGEHFIAWFEPEHHILRANAGFFVRRFAAMRWSILTPGGSLHWDGQTLHEGPPATRDALPAEDAKEDLWRAYYASIFNPARVKVGAMMSEMPRKYWHNLPEAGLIPGLIAGARARELAMIAQGGGKSDGAPGTPADIARSAAGCTRCPLHIDATQAVPGEGPADARMMIVGEQPGDQEDLAGRPFVGPAGQLLDRALAAAGIERSSCYITNAVKHFKFQRRGKRRLHETPSAGDISACRWWLDAEIAALRPAVIVALGATAARALTGKPARIGVIRGHPSLLPGGSELHVTIHPSYLLRLPDAEQARAEEARFIAELRAARGRLDALAILARP